MPKKYIMGNWKMQGDTKTINALARAIATINPPDDTEVVVFPPYIYLNQVQQILANSKIKLGAQNTSQYENGAYTGEISASMLKDLHCEYVLIGHSERRQLFNETDLIIEQKFLQVISNHLIPVLCIGETAQQRDQNQTQAILTTQLTNILKLPAERLIIAYEPIWAIGTGVAADPAQIQLTHQFLRKTLVKMGQSALPLLYGGSVKASNAQALLAIPEIDGLLIGGAALDSLQFKQIVTG